MSVPESAPAVSVRAATRADLPLIHRMIHELATYEGMPEGPELSVDDLISDGFDCEGEAAWFLAVVAERAGEVAGYALCNRAYSSWTGRALYVEDLYVAPPHRRAGVALALLRHLCACALARGAARLDWHVLESNAPARALYARLGARDLRLSEGRAALRLDRARIEAVAAGHLLPRPTPPRPSTPHILDRPPEP